MAALFYLSVGFASGVFAMTSPRFWGRVYNAGESFTSGSLRTTGSAANFGVYFAFIVGDDTIQPGENLPRNFDGRDQRFIGCFGGIVAGDKTSEVFSVDFGVERSEVPERVWRLGGLVDIDILGGAVDSFNPRLPCGRRRISSSIRFTAAWFQSTPPVWEATSRRGDLLLTFRVSIHASRVGGD